MTSGVIDGGGKVLYNIACSLKKIDAKKEYKDALEILEVALKKPFMQICENAGYDYQEVLININEDKWFDAANNTYVNMKESGIIDPASVEKSAIMSAISISGIFLTTECAIVSNDSKNPVNEENLL